jgi:hypothetical protein
MQARLKAKTVGFGCRPSSIIWDCRCAAGRAERRAWPALDEQAPDALAVPSLKPPEEDAFDTPLDKLRSYASTFRRLGLSCLHEQGSE